MSQEKVIKQNPYIGEGLLCTEYLQIRWAQLPIWVCCLGWAFLLQPCSRSSLVTPKWKLAFQVLCWCYCVSKFLKWFKKNFLKIFFAPENCGRLSSFPALTHIQIHAFPCARDRVGLEEQNRQPQTMKWQFVECLIQKRWCLPAHK